MHLTRFLAICASMGSQVAAWSFHHAHGHSHSHLHGSSSESCRIEAVEAAGEYYCGGVGSVDSQGYVYRRYTSASLNQCIENCLGTTTCESFAHHASTGCTLYTKSLRKQGFHAHYGGSKMYNRGCFTKTCASSNDHAHYDYAPVHQPPSQAALQPPQQPQPQPQTQPGSSSRIPSENSTACQPSFCDARLASCTPFNLTSPTTHTRYRAYPYAIAKSAIQSLAAPAHSAPTIVRTYDPAFFNVCQASAACADAAAAERYGSFDLHFRFSSNRYECVLFEGRPDAKDCTWFNVKDEDVSCAVGWGLEIVGE